MGPLAKKGRHPVERYVALATDVIGFTRAKSNETDLVSFKLAVVKIFKDFLPQGYSDVNIILYQCRLDAFPPTPFAFGDDNTWKLIENSTDLANSSATETLPLIIAIKGKRPAGAPV